MVLGPGMGLGQRLTQVMAHLNTQIVTATALHLGLRGGTKAPHTYSGRWHTASMLLPSGSMTKAP